jgi:hypothetical protein
MRRTPVYIVCSPRPGVGKTLIARLLTEFLLLQYGSVTAFDISMSEPSLLDYLPDVTQTAVINNTQGQMALMDRLIVNDGVPKVIDLGFFAFDEFFKMIGEIGFLKEAMRRGIDPVMLFVPDNDRASVRAWTRLRTHFSLATIIPIENRFAVRDELPGTFTQARLMVIDALPAFLKSIIGRAGFSFTQYLRSTQDQSSELHKWVRANYTSFHGLEQHLIAQKV